MDIGKIENNTVFYDGYEGEPEIVLTLANLTTVTIHIWEGYFDDLFGTPHHSTEGWIGFTKDYHELKGVFGDNADKVYVEPSKYLEDLTSYKEVVFDFEETKEVLKLLIEVFEIAKNMGSKVIVEKI